MNEGPVITTFQLDQESKRKLQEIAGKTERSMSATIRWLVSQEYERLTAPTTPTQPQPAQA